METPVTVWRLQARHTAAADIKLRIDGPEAAADNAVEVGRLQTVDRGLTVPWPG